jgi:protein SCO1/2
MLGGTDYAAHDAHSWPPYTDRLITDATSSDADRDAMSALERKLPWIIIALAMVAGFGGYWLSARLFSGPEAPGEQAQRVGSILLYPKPKGVPDIRLARSDGSAVGRADWNGRWRLVFFGFTHCPDVCPTTLSVLKRARAELARTAPGVEVAVRFVSVDPARDHGEVLARYVAFFDPAFEAITGSDEALLAFTRALGIVYARTPTGPGPFDYTIDHSSSILVIDPNGQLVGLIRPPHEPSAIATDLAALIAQRSAR